MSSGAQLFAAKKKAHLLGRLVTIYIGAPDDFQRSPNPIYPEMGTLRGEFHVLKLGIDHVFRAEKFDELREELHQMVDACYLSYFNVDGRDEARKMVLRISNKIEDTKAN